MQGKTINIKDIPGHSIDEYLLVMNPLFPFVYQFNYHFFDDTNIQLHSRPAGHHPDSDNLVAAWHIKQLH